MQPEGKIDAQYTCFMFKNTFSSNKSLFKVNNPDPKTHSVEIVFLINLIFLLGPAWW